MTVELKQVHLQRLRLAVEAARAGGRIHFDITAGEPRTVVWINERVPGVSNTILNFYGRSDVWMDEVERVYREMLYEARK
jgi:hypothetical protein